MNKVLFLISDFVNKSDILTSFTIGDVRFRIGLSYVKYENDHFEIIIDNNSGHLFRYYNEHGMERIKDYSDICYVWMDNQHIDKSNYDHYINVIEMLVRNVKIDKFLK